MTRWFFPSLGVVAALALAQSIGCDDETQGATLSTATSGQSTTTASNGGASSTSTTATGMGGNGIGGGSPSDYPPGPYGNQEGDTFPYLVWQGYVNTDPAVLSNTAPWTDTYTANDIHNSGAPYALIHTSLTG